MQKSIKVILVFVMRWEMHTQSVSSQPLWLQQVRLTLLRWAAQPWVSRQHWWSILTKCNLHASVITGSRGTMVFFSWQDRKQISHKPGECNMPLAPVGGELQRKTMFLLLASGFALFYLQNWHFNCFKGIIFLRCLLLFFSQMALLVFKNEDHLTLLQLELIPTPL